MVRTIPYLHVSMPELIVTHPIGNDLYFGGGVGFGFGTKLFMRDSNRSAESLEMSLRVVAAWRLGNAFALEGTARFFFFGRWARLTQDESGFVSRERVAVQFFHWALLLRYDDLI